MFRRDSMGIDNLSKEDYKKKYGEFFEPLNNDKEGCMPYRFR
jgi:hypothetical protein